MALNPERRPASSHSCAGKASSNRAEIVSPSPTVPRSRSAASSSTSRVQDRASSHWRCCVDLHSSRKSAPVHCRSAAPFSGRARQRGTAHRRSLVAALVHAVRNWHLCSNGPSQAACQSHELQAQQGFRICPVSPYARRASCGADPRAPRSAQRLVLRGFSRSYARDVAESLTV